MQLVRIEQENINLRSENAKQSEMLKMDRSRRQNHEQQIATLDCEKNDLRRQLHEANHTIKELQTQNNEKQCIINRMEVEQQRQKRRFETKMANEAEKTRGLLARDFKEKEEMLNVSNLNPFVLSKYLFYF